MARIWKWAFGGGKPQETMETPTASPSIRQANILFDDQILYLRIDGEICFEPPPLNATVAMVGFDQLTLEREKELRQMLKGSFSVWQESGAKRRIEEIQQDINLNVIIRAKMLWRLNQFIDAAMPPGESRDNMKTSNALALYTMRSHRFGESADTVLRSIPAYAHIPNLPKALLLQVVDEDRDPNAIKFAKQEARSWLTRHGLGDISLDGPEQLKTFSDEQARKLADKVSAMATEKMFSSDTDDKGKVKPGSIKDLIEKMREKVRERGGEFALTPENAEYKEGLLAISNKADAHVKNGEQRISTLFRLALEDKECRVVMFSGPCSNTISSEYGGTWGNGAYATEKDIVIIPKRNRTEGKRISFFQAIGRKLEGGFSLLNDIQSQDLPTSSGRIQQEELLHRSFLKLLPIPKDKGMLNRLSSIFLKDIENGYLLDDLKKLLPHVPPEHMKQYLMIKCDSKRREFYEGLLMAAIHESLASVASVVITEGWDTAEKTAPSITSYLKGELLPLAETQYEALAKQARRKVGGQNL